MAGREGGRARALSGVGSASGSSGRRHVHGEKQRAVWREQRRASAGGQKEHAAPAERAVAEQGQGQKAAAAGTSATSCRRRNQGNQQQARAAHVMQMSDSKAPGSLHAVCSSASGRQLARAAWPAWHWCHSEQAEGQPL